MNRRQNAYMRRRLIRAISDYKRYRSHPILREVYAMILGDLWRQRQILRALRDAD